MLLIIQSKYFAFFRIRSISGVFLHNYLDRVVKSRVKIFWSKIWIQIWKLKKQITFILFAYNLMIGCYKKNKEN